MARPKSAFFDLKREAILDSAAAAFARQSFAATSMQDVATALGTSKARLYHYYESKEAILFDLLDRYTQRLLAIIGQAQATAQRKQLDDKQALYELIRAFLNEYQNSADCHVVLLSDVKFLGSTQQEMILNRQRDMVAAFTRFLKLAYVGRVTPANQTALTMMIFGMINWTFTWLKPGGTLSYDQFATEVIAVLEAGLGHSPIV